MMGLFSIVPVAVLLSITFLVLAAVEKTEKGILRTFGAAIAILVVISAILVAMCSVNAATTGECPMTKKMSKCSRVK